MNDEYDIAAAREIAIGERECREQVQADNEQKPPKSWAVIHLERARRRKRPPARRPAQVHAGEGQRGQYVRRGVRGISRCL